MSSHEREPLLGASRWNGSQSSMTPPILHGSRVSPELSTNNDSTYVSSRDVKGGRRENWSGPPSGGDIISDDTVASVVVVSKTPASTALYPVRWYLLLILSMNGFVQGLIWNTFGPISETCKIVFDWNNSDIALLANWGCISFFLALFPFNFIIEKWGLRCALLIALFGTFIGTSVRLIPVHPEDARYTMHMGQFLSGIGGPVSMAVPPIFSATWFPTHQRTTATAIGALLNLLGIALSFFVGPFFVPPPLATTNVTMDESTINASDLANSTDIGHLRDDIYHLMWFEWALILSLTVTACIYFPNKPSLPPTLSAAQPKGSLLKGLWSIFKIPNFWLVAVPYGICAGCFSTYGTQLNSIFGQKFKLDQNDAGNLGLIYSCAGIAASFAMAFAADKFAGHFKLFLLLLQSIMTGFFTWICLMYVELLPFTATYLYVAFVFYAVCQTSTIPLFYEATIETVYPISDSIASCMLTLLNNIFGAAYLLIMGIPGIGVEWSNWAMLGVTIAGIPLLLCFKQSYSRSAMDKTSTPDPDVNETGSYAAIDSCES